MSYWIRFTRSWSMKIKNVSRRQNATRVKCRPTKSLWAGAISPSFYSSSDYNIINQRLKQSLNQFSFFTACRRHRHRRRRHRRRRCRRRRGACSFDRVGDVYKFVGHPLAWAGFLLTAINNKFRLRWVVVGGPMERSGSYWVIVAVNDATLVTLRRWSEGCKQN